MSARFRIDLSQRAGQAGLPSALALTFLGIAYVSPVVARADDQKLYAASIAAADATLRLHDTKAARRWLAESPKALRGFEWRYLNRRADESTAQVDAAVAVNDVAVSPDGSYVASTGRDGSVKLWDSQGLKPLRSMVGHTAAAWGVAFSPDGGTLASGSSDGTVRVWSADKGAEVHRLSPTGRGITAVAFSPDGRLLATTSWDRSAERGVFGVIKLWEPTSGRLVHSMEHGVKPIVAVAWSPDGSRLFAGTWDDDVTVWRARDWTVERKLQPAEKEPYKAVQGIAVSTDGALVAITAKDGTVRIWEVATGALTRTLVGQAEGQTQWINDAVFLDDTRLAAVSQDGTLRLWNARTGVQTGIRHGHESGITAVARHRDGSLITGSLDGTLRVWNPDTSSVFSTTEAMYGIAFSADGSRVATTGWKGLIKTFDTRTNRELTSFVGHGQSGIRIDWSRDGKHFATTGNDGKVMLWDAGSREKRSELLGMKGGESVVFHPGSAFVAGEAQDGVAKVWRVSDGGEEASLVDGTGNISDLAWSPDGALLAVATADGQIRLWDWKAGTVRTRIAQPRGSLMLAFDPKGATLAVGSSDRTITTWNVKTGERAHQLLGHDEAVHNLAFSPDGQRLASVASDHTARLWDPVRGSLLLTIPFAETPYNLAWSPDGNRLALVLLDRTLRWIEGR
jgi:WD40 repeat protein